MVCLQRDCLVHLRSIVWCACSCRSTPSLSHKAPVTGSAGIKRHADVVPRFLGAVANLKPSQEVAVLSFSSEFMGALQRACVHVQLPRC
jgi:hypothetical protein